MERPSWKDDHRRGSGLSYRLQKQQYQARCENGGHDHGPDRNHRYDAPEHDVDEVVTTRKKIHGSQYALGLLGLQWVAPLVGLIPSALHLSTSVGEVTRREVEEMAHPAHQRLLMTR